MVGPRFTTPWRLVSESHGAVAWRFRSPCPSHVPFRFASSRHRPVPSVPWTPYPFGPLCGPSHTPFPAPSPCPCIPCLYPTGSPATLWRWPTGASSTRGLMGPNDGVRRRGPTKWCDEGVRRRVPMKASKKGFRRRGTTKAPDKSARRRHPMKAPDEGLRQRAPTQGSDEGVQQKGPTKGSDEGVRRRGRMKGSNEGVRRRGPTKESDKGVQ